MICLIALVVFGILGIFSATHRKIAFEAFDCVFRKITLRKCHAGLDVRLKTQITSKFLEKNQKVGQFVYHHFELISWFFTILMLASMIWTAIAGYNFYLYGNCNGPSIEEQQGLCIFDLSGKNSQISTCHDTNLTGNINSEPTLTDIDLSLFATYKPNNPQDKIVYVGCYACQNTKKVNPIINQLVTENKESVELVFIDLPLYQRYEQSSRVGNCLYQENKVAFWEFHNQMMNYPLEKMSDPELINNTLSKIANSNQNINPKDILACSESKATYDLLEKQITEIKKMNVEGTPTIFVNDRVFIGPKPLRVYQEQLSTYTDWLGISLITLGVILFLIILYFIIFKREE